MEQTNMLVLVNEQDEPRGTMEKMEAHRKAELHRAFSVFIYNAAGDMLLQQRALNKYHSGGLWTNACCSHPYPDEEPAAAGSRRLREEMGFVTDIQPAFQFVYKASFDNGLTEYEYDHVFVGEYDGPIHPDPAEVNDYCFLSPAEIEAALASHPARFTAWFHLAFPKVQQWRKQSEVCIG
ncbi:isopentenyl-diphosphate Delta-isomerase [Flavihumibacter cheonanensis]|uniref:isopentenyl-diphosphate Delta-isomerase n=1 Tax=Flavihumibacter cheonanensis TaxID=1442385 RepID=UPI001EF8E67B|nr:isopentenyl-diphosphate Delta-isomerase [Flavihumibacter cheonanensis]MCG7753857.1 isopentenyl-diphosphate Delta-isomerase [Flavihumibacter cheonanensis]